MSPFDAEPPLIAADEPANHPADGSGSSTGAQASGQLVAMSFPGARRIAGWLFWVIFPLLCIWAVALGVSSAGQHADTHPPGIPGTFTAERTCAHGVCSVTGTFTGDDANLSIRALRGDPTWLDGTVHRVYFSPRTGQIIAADNWDASPSILAVVGGLTYLLVVAVLALRVRRRHRADAARAHRDDDQAQASLTEP